MQLDCKPERQLACQNKLKSGQKGSIKSLQIVPVAWMRAAQFCACTWQEPDMNVHPSLTHQNPSAWYLFVICEPVATKAVPQGVTTDLLSFSSSGCSGCEACAAEPARHRGCAVSRSSLSIRGTKGARAGSALDTVLLCHRRAVRLVLMMLLRSSTLLRWPRFFSTASPGVLFFSKAAAWHQHLKLLTGLPTEVVVQLLQ